MAAPKNKQYVAGELVTTEAPTAAAEPEETLDERIFETPTESKFFPSAKERKPGKEQALPAVLQIASGRMLVSDYDDVFDVLTYMCGTTINSFSYSDAMIAARKELFKQYPQMTHLETAEFPRDADEVEEWLDAQIKKFGEKIRVDKLADDDAEELQELIARKVKAVTPKKKKPVRTGNAVKI